MIDGHHFGDINKNVRDRRTLGITGTLCGQGRCGAQSDTATVTQRLFRTVIVKSIHCSKHATTFLV
jgi:hypothetical protein